MAEAQDTATSGLAKDFLLEIVTPDRQLVSEKVEALRAPGIAGEFGVLPSHVRLITGLDTGMLRYRPVGSVWSVGTRLPCTSASRSMRRNTPATLATNSWREFALR